MSVYVTCFSLLDMWVSWNVKTCQRALYMVVRTSGDTMVTKIQTVTMIFPRQLFSANSPIHSPIPGRGCVHSLERHNQASSGVSESPYATANSYGSYECAYRQEECRLGCESCVAKNSLDDVCGRRSERKRTVGPSNSNYVKCDTVVIVE